MFDYKLLFVSHLIVLVVCLKNLINNSYMMFSNDLSNKITNTLKPLSKTPHMSFLDPKIIMSFLYQEKKSNNYSLQKS